MNPYIKKLKAHLEQFPKDREEFSSVLELLCHYYTVEHSVETASIRADIVDMGPILEKLSLKTMIRCFAPSWGSVMAMWSRRL